MKEKLRRIKRGEAQLFTDLLEIYLDKVYTVLLNTLGPARAAEATQQVFKDLYNDILRKYRWQDAESFIEKSLQRTLRKKGAQFEDVLNIAKAQEAPPVIIRTLLMQLSHHHKKTSYRKTGTLAAVFVLFVLSLGYYAGQVAIEKEQGMIYVNNYETREIARHTYSSYNLQGQTRMIRNMTPLVNQGMLIDYVNGETDLECEVWKTGSMIHAFKVPLDWVFISGSLQDNKYLFYNTTNLYQVNERGMLLKTMAIPANMKTISVELQGAILQVKCQDKTYLIDSQSLEIVKEQAGDIIAIHALDQYIYRDGDHTNLPHADDIRAIKSLTYTPSGDLVVVYRDAEVVCYTDNDIKWQHQTIQDVRAKSNRYSHSTPSTTEVTVYDSHVFVNDAVATVIASTNIGVYLQVYALEDGEQLVNEKATLHQGNMAPEPILSRDARFLMFAVQRQEENLISRYLGFIDLEKSPYRDTILQSSKAVKAWALDDYNGTYFVYVIDINNQFKVIEVIVK